MASSLIKINKEIVSSAVSSVTLTGIDSTYNVYLLVINNMHPSVANSNLGIRVTEGGTANTTSNYDNAAKFLRSGSSFGNSSNTNQDKFGVGSYIGAGDTGDRAVGVHYIFNASNSSEYTFITHERVQTAESNELTGEQGGGVFTVASAVDGVHIFISSGNMETGTFTLYGLKK
tara:strand:+ start:347 stop:868 length:522 start_codon:yes stop_codon:yes gene_type:complete